MKRTIALLGLVFALVLALATPSAHATQDEFGQRFEGSAPAALTDQAEQPANPEAGMAVPDIEPAAGDTGDAGPISDETTTTAGESQADINAAAEELPADPIEIPAEAPAE